MKTKLISFLKHWPPLYHFIQICYWEICRLKHSLWGTKIEEKRWAKRKLNEIKKGFSNLNHPHRPFLLEKISTFQPFCNILEVGCGYGPNLYLLARKFPKTELMGIDINPLSIQEGNKLLMKKKISNVTLSVDKVDKLSKFQDKSFDIVFTDALLMYIGPDKIKEIIQKMLRITRQALILVEWHWGNQNKDPYGLGIYHFGCWKRNYIHLLRQFISEKQIRATKIPQKLWPAGDWGEMGYVIEVIL